MFCTVLFLSLVILCARVLLLDCYQEYKSLGIIDLSDVRAVASVLSQKRTNVFGVLTIHRKYYLQAGSPEELLAWTNALRDACRAWRASTPYAQGDQPPPIQTAWPGARPSQESLPNGPVVLSD